MPQNTAFQIAWVVDEKLSPERLGILTRIINAVRQFATVDLIKSDTPDEAVIERAKTRTYQLILAPMNRYLRSSKIEPHLGIARLGGTLYAGYFCEPYYPKYMVAVSPQARGVALDLCNLTTQEASMIIFSMLQESTRSGIRPFLGVNTPVYADFWTGAKGLGQRVESVSSIPEITQTEWNKRLREIRLCVEAFWGLVYESSANKLAQAYFQLAADPQALVLRLCYNTHIKPTKEAVKPFWPEQGLPTAPAQLLLRYADLLRVHTIGDTGGIEVVAAFFPSAPVHKSFDQLHTLWIEPVSPASVLESPFEPVGSSHPLLKSLPLTAVEAAVAKTAESAKDKTRDRLLTEAASKIKELKETVQELRSGGIGTSKPMPVPETEDLIAAFQERYFEAKLQIRQFETKIQELQTKKSSPQEVQALRQKMMALTAREKVWIKMLADTLESVRTNKKKAQGS